MLQFTGMKISLLTPSLFGDGRQVDLVLPCLPTNEQIPAQAKELSGMLHQGAITEEFVIFRR